MQFTDPWFFILWIAVLLAVLGTTAGLANNHLWISEPLSCAAVGVMIGPLGLDLLHLKPGYDAASSVLLREAARITLAIAVTGAALQLPRGWVGRNWRGLAVSLGPGMLAMWAAGTIVTEVMFRWPWLHCALVGAAIAPTDPVLAAPIVTGRLARRHIAEDVRSAVTAESGANDGLALPFVMLPLLLVNHAPHEALPTWFVHVVLRQICGAAAFGAVSGWLAKKSLGWAAGREDSEPASLLSVTLALAVAMVAAMRLLDGDGILAAFVAGLVLNEGIQGDAEERAERFNEAIGRFFDLPVLVLFGAVIPWGDWLALGWPALGFVVAILLLRRPPAWFAMRRFMPWMRTLRETLFVGWFGPVGVAALFYACDIRQRTGLHDIWPAISLVIAGSIVAHGVSGTPLVAKLDPGAGREDGGSEQSRRT